MEQKRTLVVFSGAGLSAESGLPTFRSDNGLWENHRVEDVATPEGFRRDPQLVLDFYGNRLKSCQLAMPNAAHLAIARLQERYDVVNLTQNVDDLLERAGCTHVHHLHGSLFRRKCQYCDYMTDQTLPVQMGERCQKCNAQLRPDIVWFGEAVNMPSKTQVHRLVYRMVVNFGVFVCVGTSLNVYPAARLITAFSRVRRKYLIDLEPIRELGFTLLQRPATTRMTMLADELLQNREGEHPT